MSSPAHIDHIAAGILETLSGLRKAEKRKEGIRVRQRALCSPFPLPLSIPASAAHSFLFWSWGTVCIDLFCTKIKLSISLATMSVSKGKITAFPGKGGLSSGEYDGGTLICPSRVQHSPEGILSPDSGAGFCLSPWHTMKCREQGLRLRWGLTKVKNGNMPLIPRQHQ